MGYVNIDSIDVVNLLDIVLDNIKIKLNCNFVSNDCDTWCIWLYKVNKNFQFTISQWSVNTGYIKQAIFHELADVVTTYQNNDLLPG